tara:strand:- start:20538 stop:20984 length:447 start_codon:yes stop_codon:yes gene_type:complete
MEINIFHGLAIILIGYVVFLRFPLSQFKYVDPRKVIWVVEDSEIELLIYKSRLISRHYKIRYFKSLKAIGFNLLFEKPDGVIVDYMLPEHKGDELYRLCELNDIRVLMVTGQEGEIFGVDPEDIIVKGKSKDYFEDVKQWIQTQVLAS